MNFRKTKKYKIQRLSKILFFLNSLSLKQTTLSVRYKILSTVTFILEIRLIVLNDGKKSPEFAPK
jgi:hypothetical protein